jgi:molybdate transport system substrate-binding protein
VRRFALAAAAILIATGCRDQTPPKVTVTVSAAASLREVMQEVEAAYEHEHPGVDVRVNLGASGALRRQVEQGAPVDVFVSADQETMDRGVKERVLDAATRRDFTSNSLVMVTPAAGAPALSRITDLTRPGVKRVAVGKLATVPVGRYTKQSLEAAKVWEAVEPKLVFADSVRQVLDYVARGEVEAGFVYRTDAELMKDKVRVVLTARDHAPVTYPAAVVTDSRQPALAREFVTFLSSSEAQSILGRYGFGKHD